jgi:hypothetical protein
MSGEADKKKLFACPVQVQCGAFRCLAFKDAEGNWVDFHTGKRLTGDVRVVDYDEVKPPEE